MERLATGAWSSQSPLTTSDEVAPQHSAGFNYRRDTEYTTTEGPTSRETITIQDSHITPTVDLRPARSDEPHVEAPQTPSSSSVPPIAIPYIALHNVGWKNSTFKGRKWVIMPMVAGFESNFIANTLQGLLCLPGCESVMMGEPSATSSSGGNDGEPRAMYRGSSEEEDEDEGSEPLSRAQSASREKVEEHSSASSLASERSTAGGPTTRSPCDDGDAGDKLVVKGGTEVRRSSAGRPTPVLRGGIRCQWGTRVKTAASRMYASYVMDHLAHASIQLKTPPRRPRQMSSPAVTESQVDEAEELECLRGQTAAVPRCLAPVPLPERTKGAAEISGGHNDTSTPRSLLGIPQDQGITKAKVCTSACGAVSAAGVDTSGRPETTKSIAPTAMSPISAAMTTTAVAPSPDKTAVLVGLEEGHSSDDNSPTPSSQEEEEEEEVVVGWGSTEDNSPGQIGGVGHSTSLTRMTNRRVAQDASRYRCFASNSVDNMPNYPLRQLHSDDLVDLAAFMVVRSTLRPDEATDLNIGTHLLGNPHLVQELPPGQRAALMHRAARLLEAAVFLQV